MLLKQGFDYHTAYSYYERGIEQLENSNINEFWWQYAKDRFLNAEVFPILGMDRQMILDEVKYTVDKYSAREYEVCGFLGDEFVEDVLEEVENIKF